MLCDFQPSVSFIVNFDPLFFDPSPSREKDAREKLDEVWEKLSDGGTVLMPIGQHPFSERYGWVQDQYGLSWQIVPFILDEMMRSGTKEQMARVTEAFLKMKKFDFTALQRAYDGK
jgi:predicted 3-demethylubiquinone-9 3-methyltransferase (glyoxalase superfamily)